MAVAIKNNRIDLRVDDESKAILDRAAGVSNLSLSAYILMVALKQAELDIKENETITLSNRERDMIMKMLDEPPEPTEALKKAMKWRLSQSKK